MTSILAQISWLAFFSIAAQWLGWKLKTPAIVFLLIGGFLAGPTLHLIQPEALLGDLLNPIISLAVGIILFEGALNLNFKEIREARASIRQVILVGAPVAWILTTLAAHTVAGLSLPVALTFGALLIVTGPTVIMPLLKNSHLKERPASILKWEGIINDPVGAVLAILCYEFFRLQSLENVAAVDFVTSTILAIIVIGFFGITIAYALSRLFNHDVIPEYLKPMALLSTAVVYFVICNAIEHDFGLIGVTILGVALANMGMSSIEELKKFKETLSIMLVSGVFILLTAKIDPAILFSIDWRGFAFIALLLFVIRPLTLAVSSIGTKMSWQEVILTGWIGPRGIVCAAVAGVLGPSMVGIGYEDGQQILALAFAIVLCTVFAHGLSAKPVAEKLGLAYTGKDSLIIVGASEWAVQFAKMLKSRNVDVMIADKNWHALRKARLSDIPVYYGEILSEETEYHLELARYNTLLAVSNNPAYNALVCNMFIHEFGRDKVYQFLPHAEDEHERRQIAHTIRGRTFGQPDMDYWDLSSEYMQGWRFRTSRAGQEGNLEKIHERVKTGSLKIVGYISQKGRLDLRPPEDFEKIGEEDLLIMFEAETSQEEARPSVDAKPDSE
ncbi:MAG: sodium:proton antiporter [Rhodospirillales bacterium]|nr:sodium:proton antiporter [Rhodospirillales bacterium]